MYTSDRDAYRHTFYATWQKYKAQETLTPMETFIVTVILEHPEYQPLLDKMNSHEEYDLEDNPFLHMSLHLAVKEQIHVNRPQGIAELYQQLNAHAHTTHESEHLIMQQLANCLWQGDSSDEAYWQALQGLMERS